MRIVGVRELKNRLSEYLRLVSAGEEILVTVRGEVVAELRKPGRPLPETPYPRLLLQAQKARSVWMHRTARNFTLRSNRFLAKGCSENYSQRRGVNTEALRGVECGSFLASRRIRLGGGTRATGLGGSGPFFRVDLHRMRSCSDSSCVPRSTLRNRCRRSKSAPCRRRRALGTLEFTLGDHRTCPPSLPSGTDSDVGCNPPRHGHRSSLPGAGYQPSFAGRANSQIGTGAGIFPSPGIGTLAAANSVDLCSSQKRILDGQLPDLLPVLQILRV